VNERFWAIAFTLAVVAAVGALAGALPVTWVALALLVALTIYAVS
jgi:hypothetical protein